MVKVQVGPPLKPLFLRGFLFFINQKRNCVPFYIKRIIFLYLVFMRKLFSFLCIIILVSCDKDVEDPNMFTLTASVNPAEGEHYLLLMDNMNLVM